MTTQLSRPKCNTHTISCEYLFIVRIICTLHISVYQGPACDDPGHPVDGVGVATSFEVGEMVTFHCLQPGYNPVPAAPWMCVYEGGLAQWNGSEMATCIGESTKLMLLVDIIIFLYFVTMQSYDVCRW